MARIAFPTENALGTLFSQGTNVLREQALALWARCSPVIVKSSVISGFNVTSTGSNGVNLLYGSGGHYASIDGITISFDTNQTLTSLSNSTHFIYAQLTKSSSLVTDWSLVSNTTGTTPADSVPLAWVVVTGGVAGTPVDAQKNPVLATGTYVGDGTSSRYIFIGFTPRFVEVSSGSGEVWHIGPTGAFPSMKISNTPTITIGAITNHTISSNGFNVGYAALIGMNSNTTTYYYRAWA